MNCSDFQSNLFDFREENLAKPIQQACADHLSACHSCRQLMAACDSMEGIVVLEKQAVPGPFTATRILQRIETEFGRTERQVSPAWIRLLQPVTLAVAVLCGVLLGSYTAKRDTPRVAALDLQEENIAFLKANLFIPEMTEDDKILNLNN